MAVDVAIAQEAEVARAGSIEDYISGRIIAATPEEVEAVQVFSRRLVEDYGYPKEHVQTRPQWRVRRAPSDDRRSFPADITVFPNADRVEDDLFMIVECKRKNRTEGLTELKTYMDLSAAVIGVWFNGNEHLYLRKVYHPDGTRTYREIPNIPRYRQRIEDIGLFKRSDLRAPSNLKSVFRDIRHHLAGNATGTTRDEEFARQIINLLFCKIYDELNTRPNDIVEFRCGENEEPSAVSTRIIRIFNEKVKREYYDVFDQADMIRLDADSLVYVVGELQNYSIIESDRDAVGDAFEVFIGPVIRGSEGQFFTPRNVVKMMIDILDPQPEEMLIDPACGSGGFLIAAIEHVWAKTEQKGAELGWTEAQIAVRKKEIAGRFFRGIDKDEFLAKVTKAYMAIIGDGRGGVFCENSLLPRSEWRPLAQDAIRLGSFKVVMTNPPFGAKIPVKGDDVLKQYQLGYKWTRRRSTGEVVKTETIQKSQPPQVIFLERCLQLLEDNGRLGIVMPESILGNPSYEYIITHLLQTMVIQAIVTMPEALFKTSGKGGTHAKVCVLILVKKQPPADYNVFMADVKWCGHDSRGNPTVRPNEAGEPILLDELPDVAARYRALKQGVVCKRDHLGFMHRMSEVKNRILVPKYYNPEIDAHLAGLSSTHDLIPVSQLLAQGAISISTGVEVGKMAYGTGTIPFVRTSDFSNWEVKIEFKHGVSEGIYAKNSGKADVKAGDIFLVRDGTYLIGTTAYVSESDLPMLFQSHIFRIRVEDPKKIDPWVFLACLNTPIVKRQIRAKQFTQDIIDTLGTRITELILPIPKNESARKEIAQGLKARIESRAKLRDEVREIFKTTEGFSESSVIDDPDEANLFEAAEVE